MRCREIPAASWIRIDGAAAACPAKGTGRPQGLDAVGIDTDTFGHRPDEGLPHQAYDGAVFMAEVFGGDRRALNRAHYVVAEGVAEIFNGAERQYLAQRHRNKRPLACRLASGGPDALGWPDLQLKL